MYVYFKVPLGLIFKSEQVSSDMTEILKHIQHDYVPMIRDENGKAVDVKKEIPFGGDQLTEERAVNVRKAFLDGHNLLKQLGALIRNSKTGILRKLFMRYLVKLHDCIIAVLQESNTKINKSSKMYHKNICIYCYFR